MCLVDKQEMYNIFKPVACSFTDDLSPPPIYNDGDERLPSRAYQIMDNVRSRNKKMDEVVDLCLQSEKYYDLGLITRFDLLFQDIFQSK